MSTMPDASPHSPPGAHSLVNAQQAVVGFYSDLGYDLVGEPFVEAGIPHQAMRREPPFV